MKIISIVSRNVIDMTLVGRFFDCDYFPGICGIPIFLNVFNDFTYKVLVV